MSQNIASFTVVKSISDNFLILPLTNIVLVQAASPCLLASLASLALLPLPLLANPDADPAPDLGQLQQTGIFQDSFF